LTNADRSVAFEHSLTLAISRFAVAIDGQDVSSMMVGEITALMTSKIGFKRRLMIVTSMSIPPDVQEAKSEHDYDLDSTD
jgi:hypothetical protein